MVITKYIKKLEKNINFIVDTEFFTGQPISKNGQWVDRNGKLLWRKLIEDSNSKAWQIFLKTPGTFRAKNNNENELRLDNCKFIYKWQADKAGSYRNYSNLTAEEQQTRAYWRPDLIPGTAKESIPAVTVINGITYPDKKHLNIDINT